MFIFSKVQLSVKQTVSFQGLTPMLSTIPPSAPPFARHDRKLRKQKQKCAYARVPEVHHPEHSRKSNSI